MKNPRRPRTVYVPLLDEEVGQKLLMNPRGFLACHAEAKEYMNAAGRILAMSQVEIAAHNKATAASHAEHEAAVRELEREDPAPPRMTKVYLMRSTAHQFTKIGISDNPKAREGTLQGVDPNLEIFFTKEAFAEVEKLLHGRFASRRVRGEWFDLSAEDIAEIPGFIEKANGI